METLGNITIYVAAFAGLLVFAGIGVQLICWGVGSLIEKAKRRRELTALRIVITECHEIERWCSPSQPTAVATAERIRAFAHMQIHGDWPHGFRPSGIGHFRAELPENQQTCAGKERQ